MFENNIKRAKNYNHYYAFDVEMKLIITELLSPESVDIHALQVPVAEIEKQGGLRAEYVGALPRELAGCFK